MVDFDRDGNEPPTRSLRNGGAHDLARDPKRFRHVHIPDLGDVQSVPINGKLIIGKIKAFAVAFLALEVRKARFLSILARIFEFGLGPILFHAPVVGKGRLEIGKGLFRSALRDFVAPEEVFFLDAIVLCLQLVELDALTRHPRRFPACQCPIVSMTSYPAGFAERGTQRRGGGLPGKTDKPC